MARIIRWATHPICAPTGASSPPLFQPDPLQRAPSTIRFLRRAFLAESTSPSRCRACSTARHRNAKQGFELFWHAPRARVSVVGSWLAPRRVSGRTPPQPPWPPRADRGNPIAPALCLRVAGSASDWKRRGQRRETFERGRPRQISLLYRAWRAGARRRISAEKHRGSAGETLAPNTRTPPAHESARGRDYRQAGCLGKPSSTTPGRG